MGTISFTKTLLFQVNFMQIILNTVLYEIIRKQTLFMGQLLSSFSNKLENIIASSENQCLPYNNVGYDIYCYVCW